MRTEERTERVETTATMRRALAGLMLLGTVALGAPQAASAWPGVYIPGPAFFAPPIYVPPPPVPVYVEPAPVYYVPRPRVRYYAPVVRVRRPRFHR